MTERGGAKCSAEKDLGGEVRIWYLRLALDSEGHAQCTRPLDYEERQRAQRFRFEDFSVSLGSDMPPRLAWSEIDREDSRRWRLHRLVIEPGCAACLAVDGDCHAIRVTPWRLPA